MSGKTETFVWTVKDLVARLSPDNANRGREERALVRIPGFQRPLVWNQSKREALIKSVLEGFPIGSLLMWQDPQDPDSYLLVDGQQRSATLKVHAESDLSLLTKPALLASASINDAITALRNGIERQSPDQAPTTEQIADVLIRWLLEKKATSNVGFNNNGLLSELSRNFPIVDVSDSEVGDCTERIIRCISAAVDISNMRLPVLIDTGPDSDLDQIFVKLNEQGVPLSKYQVWAAQWARTSIANPTQDIIDEQEERLSALRKQGLQYQDEGPVTSVNLFEYLNTMGHIFAKRYGELFSSVAHPKEQTYVFSIALLYFDLDLARKSAERLPARIGEVGVNAMADFYTNLDLACRTLSKSLRVLSALRLRDKPGVLPHPELQIVSLLAWLSRELRAGRPIAGADLLEAVNARYVLDLLSEPFRGPGDTVAHERVHQLDNQDLPNYFRVKPAKAQFTRAFETWLQEDGENVKKKRPITQEALKQFLLRIVSSRHVPTNEQEQWYFDVDHIQALASDLFKDDHVGSDTLAPHRLGNLCLLESNLNRRKGKSNFATFFNVLSEEEKEFAIRVGRLSEELTDGTIRDITKAEEYLNHVQSRQKRLGQELLAILRYE